MQGYQKVLCVLISLGFLLFVAGSSAFEAKMPILGVILLGAGILSLLLVPRVLQKEERKREEENRRRYQ